MVTDDYSVTYITFKKDAVRGNHYHKETKQVDVVLKGTLLGRKTTIPHNPETELPLAEATLGPGSESVHWPTEAHAYKALEDSEIISICFGKRRGEHYEEDTFRLEEPLL